MKPDEVVKDEFNEAAVLFDPLLVSVDPVSYSVHET
jgi:hypothetical protein